MFQKCSIVALTLQVFRRSIGVQVFHKCSLVAYQHTWTDLKRLPLAPIYASGPLGIN